MLDDTPRPVTDDELLELAQEGSDLSSTINALLTPLLKQRDLLVRKVEIAQRVAKQSIDQLAQMDAVLKLAGIDPFTPEPEPEKPEPVREPEPLNEATVDTNEGPVVVKMIDGVARVGVQTEKKDSPFDTEKDRVRDGLMRKGGEWHTGRIAEAFGLKRNSASSTMHELVREGVLAPTGKTEPSGKGGRPFVIYEVVTTYGDSN